MTRYEAKNRGEVQAKKGKPTRRGCGSLHLPSLAIKGFRGIKDLSLPCLGRVTLLAGKNSVGKTSVLEAVAVFAARGRRTALFGLLEEHNEWIGVTGEDGDRFQAPDVAALFHGRALTGNTSIRIGPLNGASQLKIKKTSLGDLDEKEVRRIGQYIPEPFDDDVQLFKTVFQVNGGKKRGENKAYIFSQMYSGIPRRPFLRDVNRESELPAGMNCRTLGPGILNDEQIARLWDEIALTDDENRALEALRLILGDRVERVTVIGEERRHGRRFIVKLKGDSQPVSLKSLGDGAVRLFSIVLALVYSRDGILLIDEAENGIHHSLQYDLWRMVLRIARDNNTQVLATTHSWDCVQGFSQAASNDEDSEGMLYRLERDDEDIWAIFYPEDHLQTAAEHRIEVR